MQVEELSELGEPEQKRVDNVVQILSTMTTRGEDLAEIAHDACNMVTALDLYCDLLQEPGVLAAPCAHYSGELRLVAAACRRLVNKLMSVERLEAAHEADSKPRDAHVGAFKTPDQHPRLWKNIPAEPITNMAEELLANRSLLAALAGPTICLTLDVQGGAVPVRMTGEDLTRILVNLVKNAAEAMTAVGRIHITLWESCVEPGNSPWLTLNVEDNGPGLPESILDRIFEPRKPRSEAADEISAEWPVRHRGLGLSITRSVVEAAGGLVQATNREPVGACFQIELPVRAV
ncbi:MAG: sensor histidine kinase [Terracidiphilus sp.]